MRCHMCVCFICKWHTNETANFYTQQEIKNDSHQQLIQEIHELWWSDLWTSLHCRNQPTNQPSSCYFSNFVIWKLVYACLHAYLHTYIHTFVHTFVHTYFHMYIHTWVRNTYIIHTFVHTYIHTYVPPFPPTHTHARAHAHTHTHTHTHMLSCLGSSNFCNSVCLTVFYEVKKNKMEFLATFVWLKFCVDIYTTVVQPYVWTSATSSFITLNSFPLAHVCGLKCFGDILKVDG